jgi:hypothetical protein
VTAAANQIDVLLQTGEKNYFLVGDAGLEPATPSVSSWQITAAQAT